ncbi:MAG: hypothetical protein ACLSAH_13540 [Bilophila wadsworthia]
MEPTSERSPTATPPGVSGTSTRCRKAKAPPPAFELGFVHQRPSDGLRMQVSAGRTSANG